MTSNKHILSWIDEMAALTQPDKIVWIDGSEEQTEALRAEAEACGAPAEIGIHSVRGGTIVGEHEVIFAGTDEVIRISHSAYSRDVFATGAVRAALFAADAKPGMYSMKEMLAAEKGELVTRACGGTG